VLIYNGHRHRIFDAYEDTLVVKELKELLGRGGVVAGCGTGAGAIGELMTTRNDDEHASIKGLGLLPKYLVDGEGDKSVFEKAADENEKMTCVMLIADSAAGISSNVVKSIGAKPIRVRAPGPTGAAPTNKQLQPEEELRTALAK
jgi:hypothetical protein